MPLDELLHLLDPTFHLAAIAYFSGDLDQKVLEAPRYEIPVEDRRSTYAPKQVLVGYGIDHRVAAKRHSTGFLHRGSSRHPES
jgi:hypothetical protein